jgi:hypothetical protein
MSLDRAQFPGNQTQQRGLSEAIGTDYARPSWAELNGEVLEDKGTTGWIGKRDRPYNQSL